MGLYAENAAFHAIKLAGKIPDADTRITREVVDTCHRLSGFVKGQQMTMGGGGLQMGSGNDWSSVSSKALPFCCASTVFLTKTAPFRAVPLDQGLIRPVFDTVYCTVLLVRASMPLSAVLAIFGYGVLMWGAVKLLQPDFSFFTAERERRSGEFRSA
eukprot:SAG22_NODE_109_length_19706_cov_464.723772_9_plen_157_part_00